MTATSSSMATNTVAAQNARETGIPKKLPGESENDKAEPPGTTKAPGVAPGALSGNEKRPPLPRRKESLELERTHLWRSGR